ncbi:NAD-P-binding protein [Lactarius deliciosus]|nr:NAD-P-binding protein [Lactarius deliciosus]
MSVALPFVSGASSGLGLALTRSVLARGDHVIATARSESLKSFDELRQDPKFDGTRLRFLTLDVASPVVEIKRCVDEALAIWGRIDVVVNNAEGLTYGLSEELGAEGFVNDMNTNFFGPINVTNAVLPSMRARRDGIIVFVGSRSIYDRQTTGLVSHCASKAALRSYAETLSVELATFDVRVMIALPGGFATKFKPSTRSGTPLAGYEVLHDHLDGFVQNYANIQKDDPDLGMNTLVDVVRGEGRAAGRELLSLWLLLGEDSMRTVRLQMHMIQAEMEEWGDVGSNLGLPQEQIPA